MPSVTGLFFVHVASEKSFRSVTSLKLDIEVVKSSPALINCCAVKLPCAFIHSKSLIVINYSHLCKAPCLITVYCWDIVLVIQDFSFNPLNRMLNFMYSEFHNLPVIRLAVGRQTHLDLQSLFPSSFFFAWQWLERGIVPCKVCAGHSLMPHLRPLSYEEHKMLPFLG